MELYRAGGALEQTNFAEFVPLVNEPDKHWPDGTNSVPLNRALTQPESLKIKKSANDGAAEEQPANLM